jgi:hypothetical protein
MSRTVNIPSTTITEAIGLINETPSVCVSFLVGKIDEKGQFLLGQQFENFVVSGDDYVELNGPPTTWASDKPNGTYRNDDLWHYVDLQRSKT